MAKNLLVVIDVQYGYLHPKGDAAVKLGWDCSGYETYITALENFIKTIRTQKDTDICFVKMEEHPDTLQDNISKDYKDEFTILCQRGTIHHDLLIPPEDNESVFTKFHYSAYSDREFAEFAQNYTNIAFTGTLASRCVYSTMAAMSSAGFRCYMLEDLCYNPRNLADEKKHFMNVAQLLSTVTKSRDYLEILE